MKVIHKMGARFSRFRRLRRSRILILGPDAAGKTTLLYRLKTGRSVNTIPTIGFNVESIQIRRTLLTLWDVGGQDKLRTLWKHYFIGVSTLAFVVDSSDRDRIDEANDALQGVLMDPLLDNCAILVYANKQDMEGSMSTEEVADKLGLGQFPSRPWHVQSACALTGDGLYEGLEWALKQDKIRTKKRKNTASEPLLFSTIM
uniref:ADP-ribosylation factor-like protein 14 n=1 Tax=Ciona savignyi TaxID=51511 RepID=H2Z503_CIOSA